MKKFTNIQKEFIDTIDSNVATMVEEVDFDNPSSETAPTIKAVVPTSKSNTGRYLLMAFAFTLIGLAMGIWLQPHLPTNATPVVNTTPAVALDTPTTSTNTTASTDLVVASADQLHQVNVETVAARNISIDHDATGKISFNEDLLTPIFTPYAGRTLEILANKGDYVKKGQPLVVVESPELVTLHNDLVAARSDLSKANISLDAAKVVVDRAHRLHSQEALALKDVQQAEAEQLRAQDEQQRAQAALKVVENRLALFGKTPDEILALGGQVDRKVVINAPMSGTIVERKIGIGQYLRADSTDPLFLISDLATLWVQADVYESDLASIHLHAPVNVSVTAYPERNFTGQVAFISPTVDVTTRTVRVRCLVQNPGNLLKPDMFAKIKIGNTSTQSVPVVPSAAVVTQGNDTLVFVEESPGHFRRRSIHAGRENNGYVTIDEGLRPGDRVVTKGGLLLNEVGKS